MWAGITIKLHDTSAVFIDPPPTQGPNMTMNPYTSERSTECSQWRIDHVSRQLRYVKLALKLEQHRRISCFQFWCPKLTDQRIQTNVILSVLVRRLITQLHMDSHFVIISVFYKSQKHQMKGSISFALSIQRRLATTEIWLVCTRKAAISPPMRTRLPLL